MVHVYSQKELFNSLVIKEGTVKMVDDSACEVIDPRTINVICRDGMVHALEVIRFVLEAQYNLISIGGWTKKDVRSAIRHHHN